MKITKNVLKQLIREELMNEVGMDPIALLKMLCASETIGVAMLQEMAEQVLKDPTNVLMVLGPYKEQIEQAAGMDLETAVNTLLDFSVELPLLGPMKLRDALTMAAENPMIMGGLKAMIPRSTRLMSPRWPRVGQIVKDMSQARLISIDCLSGYPMIPGAQVPRSLRGLRLPQRSVTE